MHEESLLRAIQYFGSQQELADALGVSQQAVNHWLNRNKKIPYLQALKIELYTEGSINLESLTDEEGELTFLLKNSAFLKGASLVYLPIDKIFLGDKRCPIYRDFREIPSTAFPFHIANPILVNSENQLIACECRLRSYKTVNSKVKVYRLNAKKILEHGLNINALICNLPMSERVEVGLFFEEKLGTQQGKRTDLELPHNYAEVKANGERRKIAAKISGFGSHFSYFQAKKVLKQGLPEVIKAMDDGLLAISRASHISNLSKEEQSAFMSTLNKKITGTNRCKEFAP